MQTLTIVSPQEIVELSFDEMQAVDGGYRIAGSILGGILYALVRKVAEDGGPPLPNMGFH